MYFITERDPNYTIKGSHDPLGFQALWQTAGRCVVPYLSTVSAAVRDFQILCIGYALKKELNITDQQFLPFFIRLEQLMAYTRFIYNKDPGFNGIERVKKKADHTTIYISNSSEDQLMSSQKAYGIWGKYIRPFTDIGITAHPDFDQVYLQKIKANPLLLKYARAFLTKSANESNTISRSSLEELSSLLEKPTEAERELLIKYLLQDNYEGELLRIVQQNEDYKNGISLYPLIDSLCNESDNQSFCTSLASIRQTERILSPLARIFRYLQTRSYWKETDIENDTYISAWKQTNSDISLLQEDTVRSLAALFGQSNIDLVKGLVNRNEEVAARRNSSPWMRFINSDLEINHFEGAGFSANYNPDIDTDNTYFLHTFVNLYKQLN